MRTVIGFVAASAFAAFAIQAWFAYGFARQVLKLPVALSFAVPVANDLYIVTLMVISYLLRFAHLRVRAYVWSVLGLGIATQIGAAWSFERWRATGEHTGVSVAALVPAALLAAAMHSLIIAARHIDESDDQGYRPVRPDRGWRDAAIEAHGRHVASAEEQAAGRAPVTAPPSRPDRAAQAPPISSGRGASRPANLVRELAVKRRLAGEPAALIAAELGVTPRAVQGWVKDHHRTQRNSGSSEMQRPAIAGEAAFSPKEIGTPGREMQGDVGGHVGPKGMPARGASDRMQES